MLHHQIANPGTRHLDIVDSPCERIQGTVFFLARNKKSALNRDFSIRLPFAVSKQPRPPSEDWNPVRLQILCANGFTIVEVLICLGVLAILLALVLPVLSGTRQRALSIKALSNARQLGALVAAYSNSSKDLPPVFFPPVFANPSVGAPWVVIDFQSNKVRGSWWSNAEMYHLLLDPLPISNLIAPGGRTPESKEFTVGGVPTPAYSDFPLSYTLYTEPAFWTWEGQIGPRQWSPQPLTSIAFPSQKGLLWQSTVYGYSGYPEGAPACCLLNVRTAICWSDLSAASESMASLNKGTSNGWGYSMIRPPTKEPNGMPIAETEGGILGRDR
ncbi:MAG: prepilin-type N-terminal cleavage/methylation domain-containing protein [Planctomycetes bacterium]|nr:prepilin-type N-terminal cleavage/methylation domain-containing protein [Planctomycetota bacterium]